MLESINPFRRLERRMEDIFDKLVGRSYYMERAMTVLQDKIDALRGEVAAARGEAASAEKVILGINQIIKDAVQSALDKGATDEQLSEVVEATETLHASTAALTAAVMTVPSPDGTVPTQPPVAPPIEAPPAPDHTLDPFDPSKDRPIQQADEPPVPTSSTEPAPHA